MSFPSGTRDGDFIKFEGWDLPGNDVAYYEKYDSKIQDLKGIITENRDSAFYAFNNRGWIKSLPRVDGSSFKKDAGYDVYVRVDYPGWVFYPGSIYLWYMKNYSNRYKQEKIIRVMICTALTTIILSQA